MRAGQPKLRADDPLGAMIRRLRARAEMTQAELAFQIGVDTRSVQRWEDPNKARGKGTSPGALELLKILSVFGIEIPEAPRYRSLATELEQIHARLDELTGRPAISDGDITAILSRIEHPVLDVLVETVDELRAPTPPSPARLAEMRQVVEEYAVANRLGSRLVAALRARIEAAESGR